MACSQKTFVELHVVHGPVGSGKTTDLLVNLDSAMRAGHRVLLVAKRSHGGGVSHIGLTPAINLTQVDRLGDVEEKALRCESIFIDEGQFFGAELAPFCEKMNNAGVSVFVSMLDATFDRKSWPGFAETVAIATTCAKKYGKCYVCHGPAPFSARIAGSGLNTVVVGSDKYVSACFAHWSLPKK